MKGEGGEAIVGREEAGRRKGAYAGEKKRKRRRYPGTVAHRHAIIIVMVAAGTNLYKRKRKTLRKVNL